MTTTTPASQIPNLPVAAMATGSIPRASEVQLVPFYVPEGEPMNGQPVQIGLTSGHTAIVYGREVMPEGTPLHPRFHREAVLRGCLPLGAIAHKQAEEENAQPTREQVIVTNLKAMVDDNEDSDFTREGKPDLNQLMRRCGFRIAREEADKLWTSLSLTRTAVKV